MLQNILLVAAGLVAGAVVALKVVAPLTATTKDNEVLARLEALEALLKKLVG